MICSKKILSLKQKKIQMESVHHRQVHLVKERTVKRSLKTQSSDSSDTSTSSVIFTMCPLKITSESCSSLNIDQTQCEKPIISKTSSLKSLFSNHESINGTESRQTKKLTYQRVMCLFNLDYQYEKDYTYSADSCLARLLIRPRLDDEIQTQPCPAPPPPPQPVCVSLTPERIVQLKQRHIEFERVVKKLIELFTTKTDENIKEICRYWAYIKGLLLDKYEPKTKPYQLFDYLLKSTVLSKHYQCYVEENDEIKAVLQVLSTVLTIVHSQQSFSSINQIFIDEEKYLCENLQNQLESFVSSYTDALTFICERIHYYETNMNEKNNFNWLQILQIDYPLLIEKISNDFTSELHQIDLNLVEMLKNVKKNLLKNHSLINQK